MSLSLTNILFTITVQAKKCNANYYIKGYDLLIKYLIKCKKHLCEKYNWRCVVGAQETFLDWHFSVATS